MNRRLDILTVKSRLDRPTRASWKAMKTQADGFLARHNPVYVLDSTADRNFGEEQLSLAWNFLDVAIRRHVDCVKARL